MTTDLPSPPAPEYKDEKSLVVFSGGQDSTTCLFWAHNTFHEVEALFFRYGQRHAVEEESALKIARKYKVPLHILNIETFQEIGGNSLMDSNQEILPQTETSLPNTFVPGRNLIFLTYAAAWAWKRDIKHLVTGVCETDYSGYPDCRQNTMDALQESLRLGMERDFTIHTPLMHLSKAQTVELAQQCGALDALAWSHTCYEGKFPPCGKCPSCILRARGFAEAGIADPLLSRKTND